MQIKRIYLGEMVFFGYTVSGSDNSAEAMKWVIVKSLT